MMFYSHSLWTLDFFDGYGYNNYYAAGQQAYPTGINKYYDVNSWNGQFLVAMDYTFILFWDMLSIFTILPVYRWVEIIQWFEGTLLDYDYALVFIPEGLWPLIEWTEWVTVDKGVLMG